MKPARNRYGFGIGTLGRDMAYTLVSLYLMFYLSDVLDVSAWVLGAVTAVLAFARIFDAFSDPVVGVFVDNTNSRWGRFKPWVFIGGIVSSILLVVMFTDFGLNDAAFVLVFAVVYLAWGASYTANDIGYWSMLPALTQNQKERERIGAFARICATIGTFSLVIAITPLSKALAGMTGSLPMAYTIIAIGIGVVMLTFQAIMLRLVREDRTIARTHDHTRFRDLAKLVFRNDQLLPVVVALLLFTTGFTITISFGQYYFKYVFGNEDMYTLFGAVLGVAQITALSLYPLISKRVKRGPLYTAALATVAVGYVVFYLTPAGSLPMLVVAGLLIFSAQAIMQILMLMFIADTVEYGNWKFGRRNDSVTLSLQPFITKAGSAIATAVIGWTVIASGMHDAKDAAHMTEGGTTTVKVMMLIVPLVLIAASYVVWRVWYKLDEVRYAEIVAELHARSEGESPQQEGDVAENVAK